MTSADRLRILTVCTGNVCRSPLAERLLQTGFDEICPDAVEVRSAGTHALVGADAEPGSRAIASALGASLAGFSARQLTTPMLTGADLVLAMSTEHRAVILQLAPSAFRKTFTLREFARVLSGAALEKAEAASTASVREAWLATIAEAAGRRQAGPAPDDDITDPFREGPEVYRRMAEELVPAVDAILTAGDSVRRRKHAGSP
ncbi:Low molecular weight phosphotyrosine protein phosphatase [Sinomonas atrocyanea]|uniref:Low molecular weight phosphotyrosine protein phosphatase n=1 Tax=Sinomonas atrocyanea TaxID=37927 RepID=A0A127A3G4_9MICC|nr:low molecular weight phosphatase family protein [Sinomonas atrocyanea]AMM33853.1 Low molecular weight phosphotyrosine protein phosphatase [Sinomonas atrocyanea]GEB66129.1 low molecular weight phosphatase family protein [Sinomonas atrocyanea]GGG56955.1 low molecular weight phosphatase family protein [Sinomonas atrocyanea]